MDLLDKSLKNTEQEIKKAEAEGRNIEEQMSFIETNIMKLHTETKLKIEDLINKKSEHTTIEKTASNLYK